MLMHFFRQKQNTRPVPAPSTPRLFSTDESGSPRQDKINSLSSLFVDDDTTEIKYEELEINAKLGSGGFKDCYAGKYKEVSTCEILLHKKFFQDTN